MGSKKYRKYRVNGDSVPAFVPAKRRRFSRPGTPHYPVKWNPPGYAEILRIFGEDSSSSDEDD